MKLGVPRAPSALVDTRKVRTGYRKQARYCCVCTLLSKDHNYTDIIIYMKSHE